MTMKVEVIPIAHESANLMYMTRKDTVSDKVNDKDRNLRSSELHMHNVARICLHTHTHARTHAHVHKRKSNK